MNNYTKSIDEVIHYLSLIHICTGTIYEGYLYAGNQYPIPASKDNQLSSCLLYTSRCV